MDLAVEEFDHEKVRRAGFVGISVPMHTAMRLGVGVAETVRKLNPSAHICFHGLYATLNSEYLLDTVADSVIGGEVEETMVELVRTVFASSPEDTPGFITSKHTHETILARLDFPLPQRDSLPSLERYAKLLYNDEERLAGYVEASRGCLHYCTHCPIPPVYGGRFFVIPSDVVLADIEKLVKAGAGHITFGDPDFLNGPTHSLRIVRAMNERFPDLTFDFTAKIEHVLKYREMFPELGQRGSIFMVSAVESLSDIILSHLEKGHTRDDVFEALKITRAAGITLRPSFVPFTPWTTLDDYIVLLETVERLDLIDSVDPVQYSIRLLIPPGSLLLSRSDTTQWLGHLNKTAFSYEWNHLDARMDELQRAVNVIVERAAITGEDAMKTFYDILDVSRKFAGDVSTRQPDYSRERRRPPRLTESWFCCAEPTRDQFVSLSKGDRSGGR
jgi:radical SAM superfamily enzyme YgiQ (UPF0313 family)